MSTIDIHELQRQLWSFAAHRVITVAARTGILNHLATTRAGASEVARVLGLSEAATAKILGALAAHGLVESQSGDFTIAAGLREYFTPGENDLVPFIRHSHAMYENWGANLEIWLRSGSWPHTERSPEGIADFAAAMTAMGRLVAAEAAPMLDLDGARHLLDVGGGRGHYSKILCQHYPKLRATVFDIPDNAEAGRAELAGTGLAERIDFLGGDYLEDDFGGPYDFALLANILHQENHERAPLLLQRAADAVESGGRLAILDFQIDDEHCTHKLGTLFAINMRDFGDTWTEPQTRQWMAAAGLADIGRQDLGADRWILTGRKR